MEAFQHHYLPSSNTLQKMLLLSQEGRIRQLAQELEVITSKNPDYTGFSKPILELISQYELDKIELTLAEALSTQKNS